MAVLNIVGSLKKYRLGSIERQIEEKTKEYKDKIQHLEKELSKKEHIYAELYSSEERYKRVLSLSSDAIYIHRDDKILFANEAGIKMLEAEKEEDLIGSRVLSYVKEQYHDLVKDRIRMMLDNLTEKPFVEEKFISLKGKEIEVEVGACYCIYAGEPAILVICRDITHKKAMERSLTKNRIKYQEVFNNVKDAIYISKFSEEGLYTKFLEVNDTMCKRLGYTREEMLSMSIRDIDFNGTRETVNTLNKELLVKGSFKLLTTHKTKDGRLLHIENNSILIDLDGEKVVLSIAHDITSQVAVEQALRKSRERYKTVFESLPYAVFLHSRDYIYFANKTAMEYMGIKSLLETKGKRFTDFIGGSNASTFLEERYDRVFDNGIIQLSEERLIRKSDGEAFEVDVISTAYNSEFGTACLSVLRDLTYEKQAELLRNEVEEKNTLLKETMEYDKLRTEFFANISHELRTPINVILGTLQLFDLKIEKELRLESIDSVRKYISTMKQNCYRLVRLINNLIDVTKIDAGFLQINLSNCNIISVVEDITLSVSEYVENKGVSLVFDTTMEERVTACDPDIIERIILNLISNAIKFTKPGGTIEVNIKEGKESVILSVKDNGIGIPKEKQKLIFERFVQVDKSLTRANEGSGIGLSLVKELIELHEGTIRVESELNKGSEFIIELPTRIIQEDEAVIKLNRYNRNGNIEKINIEFSDIYM